ncbi:MAG TPA: CRISPR system precrRNA processing endoribonuclease RAMP protein Cas6 [Syntrophaceae bacterium]|nr:CRISPR system precrRNA processing endoribonuclease RAMP protein Cas6 [Syntrophaceae bacterium]
MSAWIPPEDFEIATFQFKITATTPLSLPTYKGSTLRGSFGTAFKRIACISKQKICGNCLIKDKCIYIYIFETPPPADTQMMKRYPSVPHPFILLPPSEEKTAYEPGEGLFFYLTLIGRTIHYLPYFIYTFEEVGRMGIGKGRGKFILSEVLGLDRHKREIRIYNGKTKTLKGQKVINLTWNRLIDHCEFPANPQLITLNFLTPTRFKYDGRLVLDLEFHILIRNLLRRISTLYYFHCGQELKVDYKALIKKAQEVENKDRELRWYDWERYSRRQDTRMKLGGFMGRITFKGEMKEFMPYIILGEYIHVGKGTGFGLGKYEILDAR